MNYSIKSKLDEWVIEDSEYDFRDTETQKLDAVSYEMRDPIDDKHSITTQFSVTAWPNGEGFDIRIHSFNERTKEVKEETYSIPDNTIYGILMCLRGLNYFV